MIETMVLFWTLCKFSFPSFFSSTVLIAFGSFSTVMSDRVDWDVLFGLWEYTSSSSRNGLLKLERMLTPCLSCLADGAKAFFSREKRFACAFSSEKYLEVNIQYSILALQIKLHGSYAFFLM